MNMKISCRQRALEYLDEHPGWNDAYVMAYDINLTRGQLGKLMRGCSEVERRIKRIGSKQISEYRMIEGAAE